MKRCHEIQQQQHFPLGQRQIISNVNSCFLAIVFLFVFSSLVFVFSSQQFASIDDSIAAETKSDTDNKFHKLIIHLKLQTMEWTPNEYKLQRIFCICFVTKNKLNIYTHKHTHVKTLNKN